MLSFYRSSRGGGGRGSWCYVHFNPSRLAQQICRRRRRRRRCVQANFPEVLILFVHIYYCAENAVLPRRVSFFTRTLIDVEFEFVIFASTAWLTEISGRRTKTESRSSRNLRVVQMIDLLLWRYEYMRTGIPAVPNRANSLCSRLILLCNTVIIYNEALGTVRGGSASLISNVIFSPNAVSGPGVENSKLPRNHSSPGRSSISNPVTL